ncbi:uncharacterized protein ACR2FA_010206 [Aphomia sociella]
MWCRRKMLQITWTAFRTNESILRELNIKNRLSTTCLRRILEFFSHIAQKDRHNLEQLMVTALTPIESWSELKRQCRLLERARERSGNFTEPPRVTSTYLAPDLSYKNHIRPVTEVTAVKVTKGLATIHEPPDLKFIRTANGSSSPVTGYMFLPVTVEGRTAFRSALRIQLNIFDETIYIYISDFLLISTISIHVNADNITSFQNSSLSLNQTNGTQQKRWLFKDYIKKFSPIVVWEKINKRNKALGLNKTVKDELENIYKGIDGTDELLSLNIENGDTKILLDKNGRRRWVPTGKLNPDEGSRDPFYLKRRLFELMKQAIYQVRNKMVLMQIKRKKIFRSPLYKMGFLFSKTDQRCKLFSKFAYRSYKACSDVRQGRHAGLDVYEIIQHEERLVHIWFEIELLTDLILVNDENCRDVLKKHDTKRLRHWKFVD